MKKIKVLQVNKLYYPYTGGIERIVQQIAEGLSEITDMEVLVCANTNKRFVENVNGVKVVRVPSIAMIGNLPVPLGLTRMLRKQMKDRDVIHFHMPFPFADFACLLSGYKGKVVVWWHSDVVRQKKMMLLYKPIMNKFLKRADVIIVATKGHIEGSKYLNQYKDKCVIIPFGVDLDIEKEADKYIEDIHKSNSDEKNKSVRFLFIGRLVYYKGCKVLIEAFSKVERAELVIVGSGKMENEIRELANQLKINSKIRFAGEISEKELYKEYEEADVLVLPSIERSEAFGLVQIEAMAFGKPVINTRLKSGVPYVSLDKITGLTVTPGNVQELTEAMIWMVHHEKERICMGEKARQRMKNEYTMHKMLKGVLDVYDC